MKFTKPTSKKQALQKLQHLLTQTQHQLNIVLANQQEYVNAHNQHDKRLDNIEKQLTNINTLLNTPWDKQNNK